MAKKKAQKKKLAKKKAQKKKLAKKKALTQQEELFCQYYVNNRELFSDATHSYAEAYGYKLDELPHDDQVYALDPTPTNPLREKMVQKSSYDRAINICAVEGSGLLRKPKVDARIVVLLNALLTDEVVDSELSKVIRQDAEKAPKVAAIREYNALRSRIQKKIDITSNGKSLFNDETKTKTKTLITGYITETPGSGE